MNHEKKLSIDDFKEEKPEIMLVNQTMTSSLIDLSKRLGVNLEDFGKATVKIGYLAVASVNSSNIRLTVTDLKGNEKDVNFFDLSMEEIDEEGMPTPNVVMQKQPSIRLSMSDELLDDLMGMANKHHTYMQNLIEKMYILGIKIAKANLNGHEQYKLYYPDYEPLVIDIRHIE